MGFGWVIGSEIHPIVRGYSNDFYKEKGITYDSLKHPDDVGLLKFSSNDEFTLHGFSKPLPISYFGTGLQQFREPMHDVQRQLPVIYTLNIQPTKWSFLGSS